MNKTKKWLTGNLYFIIGVLVALAVLAVFLWFRITSVPKGYSSFEWQTRSSLISKTFTFQYLWDHVIYAPYYLVLTIFQHLDRYSLFTIRSPGAIFGVISAVIFFYIIWRWWGTLIAVLSTLLFTTSLWFLQSARNDGPVILYLLAGLIVILLGFVVRNKKRHETKTLLSALMAVILMYIPGMIWFILAACLLQRKFIASEFKKLPTQVKYIIPIAGLILLIPLAHACYSSLANLKTILGLPLHLSARAVIKNLIDWPLIIFIRNPNLSSFSLGHLPALSIFSDAMVVAGVYSIWLKRNLDRIYLLGSSIILAWLLFGLGGAVSIYLGLPFIMCIAATGIAYLLSQWFSVFPRNPVARSLGISTITLAVALVCWFNINQYFVAWPNAPTTISVYSAHK